MRLTDKDYIERMHAIRPYVDFYFTKKQLTKHAKALITRHFNAMGKVITRNRVHVYRPRGKNKKKRLKKAQKIAGMGGASRFTVAFLPKTSKQKMRVAWTKKGVMKITYTGGSKRDPFGGIKFVDINTALLIENDDGKECVLDILERAGLDHLEYDGEGKYTYEVVIHPNVGWNVATSPWALQYIIDDLVMRYESPEMIHGVRIRSQKGLSNKDIYETVYDEGRRDYKERKEPPHIPYPVPRHLKPKRDKIRKKYERKIKRAKEKHAKFIRNFRDGAKYD